MMAGDQLVPSPGLPVPTEFTQTGANGVQIGHADNVHLPPQFFVTLSGSASSVPVAPTTMNMDYYQLIVTAAFDAAKNVVSMDTSRALTESTFPAIADRLKHLDRQAVSELMTYPALVMGENEHYGRASDDQVAYFSFVNEIRVSNRAIRIGYYPLFTVSQQRINDLADELDIDGKPSFNELNRTHWAVKNVNLLQALSSAGIATGLPILSGGTS